MSDNFYVGYLDPKPETARRLKRYGAALVIVAAIVATALTIATGPFDHAAYEYGVGREWEGTLEAAPYPVLITVTRERFPLVAEGKHGADALISGLDGAFVRFKGTRITYTSNRKSRLIDDCIATQSTCSGGRCKR